MTETAPETITYLVTVKNHEEQKELLQFLQAAGITKKWTVVNPNPQYDGEWQGADDQCWPLLSSMLKESLETLLPPTELPLALTQDEPEFTQGEKRRIIQLAVTRWNYTSESGLDERNLLEDYLAGKIPQYSPKQGG